jgi:hypothetical protein
MASFFPALWQSLRRRQRPPRPRPGGGRWQPLFECLERRQLLSVSVAPAFVPQGAGRDPYLVQVQLLGQPVVQLSTDGGATYTSYSPAGAWSPADGVAIAGGVGTFVPQTPTGNAPASLLLATGDFNRDGKPDIALALGDRVSVLLSQANGGYLTSLTLGPAPGGRIMALATGDFNGDGTTDLVTVAQGTGLVGSSVDVLLGTGTGAFRTRFDLQTSPTVLAVTVGASQSAASLTVADAPGSPLPDLTLVHRDAQGSEVSQATFTFDNGDGTSQAPAATDPGTPSAPPAPAVVDPAPQAPAAADPAVTPARTPAANPVVPPASQAATDAPAALSTVTPPPASDQEAHYLAVASAVGGDSLPLEFVIAPNDGTVSADTTAGGSDSPADPTKSMNLVGQVDATGTGDFQATPISFTALASLPDSTSAGPTAAFASGSARAGSAAQGVPSPLAIGPAVATGRRDDSPDSNGPDLRAASTAGPADGTPSLAREVDDALVSFGFLFLSGPADRAEALSGAILPADAAMPGVQEANPEGRAAMSIAPVEFLGESPRSGEAAPPDAGTEPQAVPPQPAALGPRVDSGLFWSGLDLKVFVGDVALGALRREPASAQAPGAAEAGDGRFSLLRVGQFLAQAFYLQKLQSAGPAAAGGTVGLAQGATDQMRAAEVVQEYAAELTRLVRGFYERFLGRAALNGEEQGWVNMLLGGQTEENVLSAFLSTEEFGQRAVALAASVTADEAFIQGLYALLLLRVAADEEVTAWLTALPTLGRRGVALSLLRSAEYRRREIESYFREMLQREGSADEVADWAATPFDLRRIRELFVPRPERLALE